MPARRLPWFKMWPEAMRHEKIVLLSDGAFRTWIKVLADGSEQSVRWRFGSLKHAVSVTGRPGKHLRELIAARLLDEGEDGELWVHDWRQWQDRYESDFAPRTLQEDSANAPRRLRAEEEEEEEEEKERDTTHPKPFPPSGKGLAAGAAAISEDAVERLSVIPSDLTAMEFHDAAVEALTGIGFDCQREVAVADRGDGRPGRVDLVAERGGERIAIELDYRSPRLKSAKKLRCIDGVKRVIVLRCPFEDAPLPPPGIDAVIAAGQVPIAPSTPLAAPASPSDFGAWERVLSAAEDDLNPFNVGQLRMLVPIGRGADGGLQLRAPPGLGLSKFHNYVTRVLSDAGDQAASRVAIVE